MSCILSKYYVLLHIYTDLLISKLATLVQNTV